MGVFGKVKKWVFNYGKVIFINGIRGFMKNRGILWRKKGSKRRFEKGENEGLSAVFHLESTEVSEYKMEIVMKISG